MFNKAIYQYINKVYNVYDINQQTTDDLRVLKGTAYLTPTKYQYGAANQQVGSAQTGTFGSNPPASSYLSQAHSQIQSLHGATYQANMPADYMHLLNCVCVFYVAKTYKCWDAGSYIEIPATRLTADSWSQVLNDLYNRPSPTKPYYYIHNQNTQNNLPTNPITELSESNIPNGTDMTGTYLVTSNNPSKISVAMYKITPKQGVTPTLNLTSPIYGGISNDKYYKTASDAVSQTVTGHASGTVLAEYDIELVGTELTANPTATPNTATATNPAGSNFPRTLKLDFDGDGNATDEVSLIEKSSGLRVGNASSVRIEVRYGKDDAVFQLKEIQVDYVKVPQYIRLTQEQIDLTEDTSQIMEFPDYVCQEIINELVHLVMERTGDPRLQTSMAVDKTIAYPTQQAQTLPTTNNRSQA